MKSKDPRRVKISNLLEVIKGCIESGKYRSCLHLQQREMQRNITRQDVLHVLRHGYHEKKEDDYAEQFHAWNYAIRGETVDQRVLRVFVSFDEETMMIIITTFEVGS